MRRDLFTRAARGGFGLLASVALALTGQGTAAAASAEDGVELPSIGVDGDVELVGCDEPYGGINCGDCCDVGCGDSCCGCDGLLGYGLIQRSDHCYDCFISPMTNPVYFEDPRNLTEVRGIFIQHKVPAGAGDGNIQLYAAQLRASISDRLSIIATKDGYATSTNALIDDGFADVNAGLKYLFYSDPQSQRLASAGLTYTLPVGTPRTLQARGDGDFHMFLTGGSQIGDYGHVISAGGLRLPVNNNWGSQMSYWSNHFDVMMARKWYLLTEFNWYHWIRSGRNGIAGVEGGDLFNIGSPDVSGNDIVTGAFGAKYKPTRSTELGIAWENPLTRRRDVLENRITVDAILRY